MLSNQKTYFFLLFLAFNLVGCSHDNQLDIIVAEAEQLISINPDSAIILLDNIKDRENVCPKSQRMRYELVYAQAQNKAFIPFTTDSIVLELVDYYNHHGSTNERMIANYMVGCAYRDLEDAPTALKYMNIAVDVAEQNMQKCDLRTLMGIHSQMGALYHNVSAFESQRHEDSEAEQVAWLLGDTLSAMYFCWSRACCWYDSGYPLRAIDILDSIDVFVSKHKLPYNPFLIYPMKISYSLDSKDVSDVAGLIKEYEEKLRITSDTPIEDVLDITYFYKKGRFFLLEHQPDSAIHSFRQLLSVLNIRSLPAREVEELKQESFRGLMDAYGQMQYPDSSIKYANLYCEMNDSVIRRNSSEQLLRMQSLYNYSRIQERALCLELRAGRLKSLLMLSVFMVIVCGVIAWLKHQSRLREERQKLTEANKEYQLLLQEMDKSTKELRLVKKDSERFLHQKEDEIQKLHSALAMYRGNEVDIELWDKERSIIDCEIAHHLHSLSARGKMATQSELDCLSTVARDSFPNFFDKISQEAFGLSTHEILVCVLIRFRFIPSEIVVLMGYSSQRVTNIKASINKKLFSKSGAKTLDARLLALK